MASPMQLRCKERRCENRNHKKITTTTREGTIQGNEHGHGNEMTSAKGLDPNDANQARDPVCGMTVGPDSPHRGVHAGTSYLFCSARCLSEFRKDPGKYTG